MDAELSPKNIGGLSVKTLLIPTAVIVAILHVLIILTILSSDKANIQHSSTLQETGQYTQELNDYMGNVSRVCETASSFVMMPVTGAGDVNAGPLFTYAEALDSVQARDQLLERFRSYGVNPAAVAGLEEAVSGSQKWAVNQSLGAAVSIL